jgi:hypothetical protein
LPSPWQVIYSLSQSIGVRDLVLSIDGSIKHAFEAVDSHPYLLLAIEHYYASTGDYTKRAARRELYEKSLRLTFNKSAVKGGFENRQVINSELFTDNKLLKEQDFIILINVDKNKIL